MYRAVDFKQYKTHWDPVKVVLPDTQVSLSTITAEENRRKPLVKITATKPALKTMHQFSKYADRKQREKAINKELDKINSLGEIRLLKSGTKAPTKPIPITASFTYTREEQGR